MAEFQPKWDADTLRTVIDSYKKNPKAYPESFKQSLQQHAEYHNIPFYAGDFSLSDALTDLGAGFIEGFTTLHVGDTPDNEYEAIFRNLGHLAGFAPGIIGAPLGAAGKAAAKVGLAGASAQTNSLLAAAQMARKLNDKSVPMFAAKKATDFAKKNIRPFLDKGQKGKFGATQTATNFLLGNQARHIAEGAFHLGAASAVSAWQGGIDEMMSAFIGGAQAGAVFRGIGNFINTGSEAGTKVARSLAGSLFMGLPATMRGATTPEQVYEYVMGAWFGGQEKPWTIAKAGKFREEFNKDMKKDGNEALERFYDPSMHPKYEKLPPEVKTVVKEMFNKELGVRAQNEAAILEFALKGGVDLEAMGIKPESPEGQRITKSIEKLRELDIKELEELNELNTSDLEIDTVSGEQARLGGQSLNIIKNHIRNKRNLNEGLDIFKDITSETELVSKTKELSEIIGGLLKNTLTKETGIAQNESEAFVKDLKKMLKDEYNFTINPKDESNLQLNARQWVSRRNQDQPVKIITINQDGTGLKFIGKDNPSNLAGDKKLRFEPYKIIDDVLYGLTGNRERATAILDEIIIKDKNGNNRALNLSQVRKEPFYKNEFGGEADYRQTLTNVMKIMKGENFYYFGGKGAKDDAVFTKFHPETDRRSMSELTLGLNRATIDKLRLDFNNKFKGIDKDYFNRAFKSNILWNLSLNGLDYSPANVRKLLSKDFINNAVAWNKRSQVWMTDSYPGEKEFYQNKINDLSKDGNFIYQILKDPQFKKEISKQMKSSEMPQDTDGAFIVRDDVLESMNLDAGTFAGITQNKSFIISPHNQHGALLGKFMFHPAGKAQSAQMRADGHHIYMYESGVKQKGTREFYTEYELNPEHIRFSYGVKQGADMIKPQTIKKQILTNLVEALAFSPKLKDGTGMQKVVEDIFDSVIEPRFRGTKEGNEALEKYLEKLPTASNKELIKELDALDFNSIGLSKILSALNKSGNQLFINKAYQEMLKNKKRSLEEDYQNGDITDKQYESQNKELEEYNSLADRMISDARADAISKNKPENEAGIYVHPFINSFRQKVLSSYILNQATKPKIVNSGAARMRPYDEGLKQDLDKVNKRLKELDKNDELFFLDKAYEDMFIETESFGRKKLRDLWEMYEKNENSTRPNKEVKEELEETFRSAVMRVPMDSISGTQVLRFSGFTGREGHGILMHSRAMEALGGADLDGDSAYFYMGGKGGFKKSWKDMFKANKEEYYDAQGKVVGNKPQWAIDLLTTKYSSAEKNLIDSPEAVYAPNVRMQMSEAAVGGRGLLGTAVTQKNLLSAAYNMMIKTGGDTYSVEDKYGNTIDITITPKTNAKQKDYIRKLSRAMIGLSSDPMDYAGMKGYQFWYRALVNAHFNIETSKRVPTGRLMTYIRNNGIIKSLTDANSAFYGKDYTKDRQWSMEERRKLTKELAEMPDEQLNTITPKISKMLHGLDYSDNALRKVDLRYNSKTNQFEGRFKELFDQYDLAIGKYDYLKQALQRSTFRVITGKYILKSIQHDLLSPAGFDRAVQNEAIFNDIIKGTPMEYEKTRGAMRGKRTKWDKKKDYSRIEDRIEALNQVKEMAGDFVMKDIENLVTVTRVSRIIDAMKEANPELSDAAINKIIRDTNFEVQALKINSYLMRDAKNESDPTNVERFKKSFIRKMMKTEGTQYADQAQIDNAIRKWKRGKSALEQQLFDTLMLGSLNRGNLKRLEQLKAKTKLTDKEQKELEDLYKETARTDSSRLGYGSAAIPKESRSAFLGEMLNIYSETSQQRAPEQIRKEGKLITEEPQKQENIEKGFPEKGNEKVEGIFTTSTGWEGVKEFKKVELDPETKGYINDILTHLKTENKKVLQEFGGIVRSLLRKDINILNKADWFALKNWLDDVKRGTLWQRLSKGEFTKLSERHYMQFPETINRELMKDEIVLMQEQGMFLTADGINKMGRIITPTQYMDKIKSGVSLTNDAAIGKGDEEVHRLAKDLIFLDTISDSKGLHEIAVAKRQLGEVSRIMSDKSKDNNKKFAEVKHYKDLYNNIIKAYDYEKSLKNKIYNITVEKEGQPVRERITGEQLIDRINDTYTKFFERMFKDYISGDVVLDARGQTMTKTVTIDGKKEQVAVIPTSIIEGIPGFTSGKKNSGYMLINTQPNHPLSKKFKTGYYDKKQQNPIIDIEKFSNDMKRAFAHGDAIPTKFGVDGMNKIVRSMMIEMGRKNKDLTQEELELLYNSPSSATGRIPFENYWMHMHFDKGSALKGLKEYAKNLRTSELSEKETNDVLKKIVYRHHALTGDWNFQDIEGWKGLDEVQAKIGSKKEQNEAKIRWINNITKPGSTMSREAHIPGYSLDRQVPMAYAKSIINSYYRQMAQVFSRDAIDKFGESMYKRKVPKEQQEAWTTFMKLYVQGAIGNPDIVPEHILNDPKMKMRATPYGWWADNRVRDRVNKIAETIGVLNKDLPKELRGFTAEDMRNWSNLEAKFELASLLAHPKSMVANIFGGTMHTIQSVGFETWRSARNNKYMESINPEFATKQGRDNMAVKHGVFPEQMMEEYGLMREYQSSKNKEFIEGVARKLRADPELSEKSVIDMAKKSEITKPVMEFAAKFMSVPERALRRDAFMAHYLHWYRKFGGAIKDFDHPILIKLAKKGVAATQFLYSAPYRPMFARTALGKVMTRFQLWGWNAVRFRKEALRQARMYGFRGAEAERAARMMQMDLFVFSLGNAFAYSLFETAMPAPWNWFQDTADWVFGDEKERNRAFFGQWPTAVAPLQMITPPIARMPMASMRAMLEDDWSRVSDYYIYTMFPFGRIARDFGSKNNLIDNPLSVIDKWTGLPMIGLSKAKKDREKRKEEGYTAPTPGTSFY